MAYAVAFMGAGLFVLALLLYLLARIHAGNILM
jgi:hypothetical protein